MGYFDAFAISASGMNVERLRLEATALNIANAGVSRGVNGAPFKPLRVISSPTSNIRFDALLDKAVGSPRGVAIMGIQELNVAPRLVFDPGHPDADAKGFVSYPGINPVAEMVNLMATVRAYEANVVAMNAAKTMALRALDIGRAQ